jgi:guanylate kinase
MIKNDELLEHNVFVGNYYGTPKAPVINCIENGKDMLIEVDVNGAEQIRGKMSEAVSIFIMPPSLEVLKKRLTGRGTDSAEVIEKRLNEALREIASAKDYDYIVVNDDLETAADDFVKIMSVDKFKTDRNLELINKILNK